MGRQELDLAVRRNPELDAGASDLQTGDAFLDDSPPSANLSR